MPPEELVEMLNTVFSRFDELVEEIEAYKVETASWDKNLHRLAISRLFEIVCRGPICQHRQNGERASPNTNTNTT